MPIVYRPPTQTVDSLILEDNSFPFDWNDVTAGYVQLFNNPKKEVYKFNSFAEIVSRRICSRFNKNAILSLFGAPGEGKSMAALELAQGVAAWNAHFLGGDPKDYFSLENVAVIHPAMLRDMMKGMKRHNVYILDDAGAAYDARNYMKTDNKSLGYVLQTFRTLNGFLIVTGVDGAMLDVNLHRTARYYAEVGESRHDLGFTDIKVFKTLRKFRQKKIFYRFLSQNKTPIIRYRSYLPDENIRKRYEQIRKDQADRIQRMDEEILGDKAGQKKLKEEEKRKEKKYLVCPTCGYDWYYGGKKKNATCPDCNGRVPTTIP